MDSPCIHQYTQHTSLYRIHFFPVEQALKLVKQIMAVDPSRLPREVVRTVVAVSGHKEDNFRRVREWWARHSIAPAVIRVRCVADVVILAMSTSGVVKLGSKCTR